MKSKLGIACAALLTATALPALALQLGEIQVKSALNQPLVAAIPLQPKNLTKLEGLSVSLGSTQDFARAGLQITPTDQTLQFRVVTDNNGQKLILVTSSQPVTDPYLDFLVQVNTRAGKQVREFVVLLNPTIATPAPEVQEAPVAAPVAPPPRTQPAELPPSSAFAQPTQPAPKPAAPRPAPAAPPPAASAPAAPPPPLRPVPQGAPRNAARPAAAPPRPTATQTPPHLPSQINVHRGDTLYGIANNVVRGSEVSVDQMMLALKASNPDAFFKDNINSLKAGAILRIPTRDLVDQRSAAAAAAEVHRQYESWRALRPHPATVVEGTAAQAAANAAPKPSHAPPASDHLTLAPPTSGAGGTNSRPGVAGGTGTATIAGLQQQLQANRDTLISLKQSNADLESRIHSLQGISAKSDKLLSLKDATIAELQHKLAAVQSGTAVAQGAPSGKVNANAKPAASAPVAKPAAKPAQPSATPWYMRPLAWIIAALVVLALIVLGLSGRRRKPVPEAPPHGPLADPDDVAPHVDDAPVDAHEPVFEEAAASDEVIEVVPAHPAEAEAHEDPYGLAALREPVAPASEDEFVEEAPIASAGEPTYSDDPVDTKLDLARAYLDMGDPVGARAMLEEVLEEGTQIQKDEARRLLAGVEA